MITCGIPVYNQGEYLADAIDSCLTQSKPCEIIVVVDGATDHSLQIAKSYEPKVKVISQVNKGLASARNTAIMNMTGEYFLPLDADDMLMENCIERVEEAIDQHHPDVIAPSFKCFGIADHTVILKDIPTLKDFKEGNRLGYFSAIKKSVLQEIGGYSPRMTWGYEDYAIWMDIFSRGHTVCLLQDILVLYRTKEKSMLTTAKEHHDELTAQLQKDYPHVYEN